jgi:hypothetical protein
LESVLRIIAFGCSQTYGHCLEDAYVVDNTKWDKVTVAEQPSKLAYPQLLGDYFNCEVHNLSYPGASNRNMWYEIINFDFLPTDIVICTWTMTERTMILQKQRKHHLGIWPSANPLNKAYQKFVSLCNDTQDLDLQTFLYIDHSHTQITLKTKRVLHYKQNIHHLPDPPAWFTVSIKNSLDTIVPYDEMDFALDNQHYGPVSHQRFATQMIEDISTI